MTYPEAIAIVGGSVVAVLGVIVGIVKLRNVKSNGTDPLRLLHEAIREQTGLLREIRDGLVTLRSDQRMASLEQAHLQKSVEAVHARLDRSVGAVR
jgi:hypothetical protein